MDFSADGKFTQSKQFTPAHRVCAVSETSREEYMLCVSCGGKFNTFFSRWNCVYFFISILLCVTTSKQQRQSARKFLSHPSENLKLIRNNEHNDSTVTTNFRGFSPSPTRNIFPISTVKIVIHSKTFSFWSSAIPKVLRAHSRKLSKSKQHLFQPSLHPRRVERARRGMEDKNKNRLQMSMIFTKKGEEERF